MYVSKPLRGEGGGGVAKGDKIRIGCLTPAFWRAHKWAEMLRHPCILDDSQQRGQNQNTKKQKKQKRKFSHDVYDSASGSTITPNGV